MQTTLPTTDDWDRIDSKAHKAIDGSRRDGVAADNIIFSKQEIPPFTAGRNAT
jgi:hypothetical protein